MMTHDDAIRDLDRADYALARIGNLSAALDLIADQFVQIGLEGDAARLRDALVGVVDALSREVAASLPGSTGG